MEPDGAVLFHEHVVRALGKISVAAVGAGGLDDQTVLMVQKFLGQVSDAGTVYPSIVPDGGAAVLHWVAAPMSIVVEVDANGPVCCRARFLDGSVERLTDPLDPWRIPALVRRALVGLTDHVELVNPGWRSVYRITPEPSRASMSMNFCFESDAEHQCRLRDPHDGLHRCCSCEHEWEVMPRVVFPKIVGRDTVAWSDED